VAVSAQGSSPDAEGAPEAPGRHQPFDVDPRRTVLYRVERMIFATALWAWFRPKVVGREHVPATGAAILAPVHRSFADFGFAAFCTKRKLFFMAKDSLWKNKALGQLLLYVGAFPVHRESADREALQRAEEVLKRGQCLVLFPEGTRRDGAAIENLMEGAAFLSARTGAPIVPIGIGGTAEAMPKGSKFVRPVKVHIVVGPPIEPPERSARGRVPRSQVHVLTEQLRVELQSLYDDAEQRAKPRARAPR
jgi:1-acyl-sn-glycerol-3-phosphate acyltransferase